MKTKSDEELLREYLLDLAVTELDSPKTYVAKPLETRVREIQSAMRMARTTEEEHPLFRPSIDQRGWSNTGNHRILISSAVGAVMEREFKLGHVTKYRIKCDGQNNEYGEPITVDIDYETGFGEKVAIHITEDTAKCFTNVKDLDMGLTEVKSEVF